MQVRNESPINLFAYFQRIEYAGGPTASVETLRELHVAHATHIPFENIDVMLKRPIRLDLESLQAKLVRDRRGGYCFEQNLLFAAILKQIGFDVTLLQARVRFGTQRMIPRTHLLLAVTIDSERWLADLGFGSYGLLQPIPLRPGEYHQCFWTYRLEREGDQWVLRAPVGGAWQDLYVFDLSPQLAVDFEPPNHYVSTHPDSRFVQTLTVQNVSPDRRLVLRNSELTTSTRTGDSRRQLTSTTELFEVLATQFGLHLPPNTPLVLSTSGFPA
jgi:N-hydroxyarylamine O-acetyltransferase